MKFIANSRRNNITNRPGENFNVCLYDNLSQAFLDLPQDLYDLLTNAGISSVEEFVSLLHVAPSFFSERLLWPFENVEFATGAKKPMKIRENFQDDPLNIKDKVVIFNKDWADSSESSNWGVDFPKGFKTRVVNYELEDRIYDMWSIEIDFTEFLEENRKLWEPAWKDEIDGVITEGLTWEQCPNFWQGTEVSFTVFHPLAGLPFDPVDEV